MKNKTVAHLKRLLEVSQTFSVAEVNPDDIQNYPGAVGVNVADIDDSRRMLVVCISWLEWDEKTNKFFVKPSSPIRAKLPSKNCGYCCRDHEEDTVLRILPRIHREFSPWDGRNFWHCSLQAIGFMCDECYAKEVDRFRDAIDTRNTERMGWRHMPYMQYTDTPPREGVF